MLRICSNISALGAPQPAESKYNPQYHYVISAACQRVCPFGSLLPFLINNLTTLFSFRSGSNSEEGEEDLAARLPLIHLGGIWRSFLGSPRFTSLVFGGACPPQRAPRTRRKTAKVTCVLMASLGDDSQHGEQQKVGIPRESNSTLRRLNWEVGAHGFPIGR